MPPSVILGFILALIVIALFTTLVGRYRRCPSNKILVIYGKTGRGAGRTIHGGAAFVWPLLQDYAYLDLEPFVVPIELDNALSQENIRVSVPTTVTAAISTEPGLMQNAAIRLLGLTQDEIQNQAQDIILGQMRAVIATMEIEQINRDRQAFMGKVNEAVSSELEKIGLGLINVNIRDIEDESGYIQALGKRAAAEVINQALVDVSEQERIGQTGVAERERDRRRAVAAADAAAVIGEKEAERDRRRQTAQFDMQAVETETETDANKAAYVASLKVAEEQARQKGQEAAKVAEGAIRLRKSWRNVTLRRRAPSANKPGCRPKWWCRPMPSARVSSSRRKRSASGGFASPLAMPRRSDCASTPRPRARRRCWRPRHVAMRAWSRPQGTLQVLLHSW